MQLGRVSANPIIRGSSFFDFMMILILGFYFGCKDSEFFVFISIKSINKEVKFLGYKKADTQ